VLWGCYYQNELPCGIFRMLRVPYDELLNALLRVLLKLGFSEERGRRCAQLFVETTRDGIYSHGLNRFPRFIRTIQNGLVDVHAQPKFVQSYGSLERWDGRSGPGNLNAWQSMERAIALSRGNGIGCVALSNTNHWMRGGSYGWQAADARVIGICWTNTLPNLPPWGASDPRVGNNPLVIAVPRPAGHIVLDTAMSQFSYGALASYRASGEPLPVDGGFDTQGRLTRDAGEIEKSSRPLPIGYWKGSGLALMLDLLGGILSGGQVTYQIPADPERETRLSQVFIAIDPSSMSSKETTEEIANQVIAHFQFSTGGKRERVRYPGERVLKIREENVRLGIPVDSAVWEQVQKM
jgi:3-dehydro-L-gulonate 2-dehydrogenase